MSTPSGKYPHFAKIVVTFETRPDGGLRAFSDDVPGFVLSHSDPEAVLADVKPALEVILSHMFGTTVVVDRLPALREHLLRPEAARVAAPPAWQCQEYLGRVAA